MNRRLNRSGTSYVRKVFSNKLFDIMSLKLILLFSLVVIITATKLKYNEEKVNYFMDGVGYVLAGLCEDIEKAADEIAKLASEGYDPYDVCDSVIKHLKNLIDCVKDSYANETIRNMASTLLNSFIATLWKIQDEIKAIRDSSSSDSWSSHSSWNTEKDLAFALKAVENFLRKFVVTIEGIIEIGEPLHKLEKIFPGLRLKNLYGKVLADTCDKEFGRKF